MVLASSSTPFSWAPKTKFGKIPEPKTLTPERLKALLVYDETSGVFRWIGGRPGIKAGRVAGSPIAGYNVIRIDGRNYRASHLAFLYKTGSFPKSEQIDHRDLNRGNDAWDNLREATNQGNMCNTPVSKNCQSGLKGAYPRKDGRWRSQIMHNRRSIHLGHFDTAEQAHAAYCVKATELFGEFARTQ